MKKKDLLGKDLALTPTMGWNSYNTFCCEPTEELLKQAADAMVESGLKDAGYNYVNIDDGWMAKERDSEGNLIPHPEKFPNGLKVVVDYIHSKGLKAGIYLGCGVKTYGDYPGSLGYEERDAQLIADCDFDLLKYDYRILPEDPKDRGSVRGDYETMMDALIKAGRPMLFSICEHGKSDPWTWGAEVGHIWRTSPDIKDGYDGKITWGWGFQKIIEHCQQFHEYAGPGGWNDPDMLIVGLNGKLDWQGPGCTETEYRTHFALWCLSASPLLIGCDVRDMDDVTKEILMNKELIAINQDALGVQGYVAKRYENNVEIWVKPLVNDEIAVGLYNRSDSPLDITLTLSELGIKGEVKARDLWSHEDLGPFNNEITRHVDTHGLAILRLKK
jgi:alpha-galactosidase